MRRSLRAIAVGIGLALVATSAALAIPTRVPTTLVGTWGKTFTAATWKKHGLSHEAPGHWALRISGRDIAAIAKPPGRSTDPPLTTMSMTVTGHTIVFGPTADGFSCPHKGAYDWSVSGHTLSLRWVNDDCPARIVLFTTGSFTRS